MNDSDGQGKYSVRLYREDLNFSAAHISTYGNQMEGQHGHNYQLSVEFRGPLNEDSLVIDFRVVKTVLKAIKDNLNHRILVPLRNPHLTIQSGEKLTGIQFGEERIELLTRDVVLLDVANVTSEMLAHYIFESIQLGLGDRDLERLEALSVEVIESPGQLGRYEGTLGP